MKGQSENNDLKKKFDDFTYPVSESIWDAISSRMPEGSPNGFLGDKFSNYAQKPSSDVWNKISAVLHPGFKKRPVAWWWYGAAASLLIFIFLGYALYDGNNDQILIAQEKSTNKQTETTNASESSTIPLEQDSSKTATIKAGESTDSITSKVDINAISESSKETQKASENEIGVILENEARLIANTEIAHVKEHHTDVDDVAGHDYSSAEKANTTINPGAPELTLAKMELRNPGIERNLQEAVLAGEWNDISFAEANPDQKRKKETGFFDGTETSASQELSLWGGSQIAFASTGGDNNDNMVRSENFDTGSGISYSSVNSINHYSPPIYFGVNGEIKFSNRFAGGLGFGYLRMFTTSTQYFGAGNQKVDEITDSYLSVPIYLKFNFINKQKFAAYTSVGHALDVMIGQKVDSDTYQNSQLIATHRNRNGHQGNQANIYMGLGMHFKFTNYLGVFAEGSLMHYYKMSKINFYSQQNYWPGLRFGVLFSFE